ncbi:MAG: pyruvate phosphate dikinase [Latescibacteria bacterium DG_63]|nr:MAG: pyruvate phosphate dikinase [Latescibacteria bacterium DG_63]
MNKQKYIFFFGEEKGALGDGIKDVLGGKGAGLSQMTSGGFCVPPGFTISTQVCLLYYESDGRLPDDYLQEEHREIEKLERVMKKKLGDENDPLLVSVRSGAKFSMPGMMDTILNLGLSDRSVGGLAGKTGNERLAYDAFRRFIQMFGSVVLGINKSVFEDELQKMKDEKGVSQDTELEASDLEELCERFKQQILHEKGVDFPQDAREQLRMARDAVFRSWNNERAIFYRKQHGIPDSLGTAVNVQAMVFGNMGPTSGTGVGFTRNPSTGEKKFYGEYLMNAQGEDVVAGIRTPKPVDELSREMPEVYRELRDVVQKLEQYYKDMQDFEFTIQEGRLYVLQTRTGKRTGPAAVRIAIDMQREGLISKEEALLRVPPDALDQLLHRQIDRSKSFEVLARGLAASPGAASGAAVFTADDAVGWSKAGKKVILVRNETNPDDIHGMHASEGILTSTGGMTSHAAVVARGMGKSCVAGCSAAKVSEREKVLTVGNTTVREGDLITIDGSSGEVILGEVPTVEPKVSGEFAEFMGWADEVRRLKVRANADTPADAAQARKFGAEGIGLCRTEHMFFAEKRLPVVQRMIMYAAEAKAAEREVNALVAQVEKASGKNKEHLEKKLLEAEERMREPMAIYKGALEELLPFQKSDFLGLFKEMESFPVTIRTLDPPLHEFLPRREELMVEVALLEERRAPADQIESKKALLRRVDDLHEFNPMLGHRGCRLGIAFPEITEMQARAIFEASCELAKDGKGVIPEIMIPLVGHVNEFTRQKEIIVRVAEETMAKHNVRVDYLVGTMIEVPRAAITSEEIAREAEFFSFGTNDLTQMTFGFSRDDAGKFLPDYIESGILESDPFVTIDKSGVGELAKWSVQKGRKSRSDLKVGICGEHGGEPVTVNFCHEIGLDYVSCSPFRVPIARLSAAQAQLREAGVRESLTV